MRQDTVDVLGLLVTVVVTAASAQDRDTALLLARRARRRLALIWADQGYEGPWAAWARHEHAITVQIVQHPKGQQGFTVLPRRWLVERTNAWISRRRRCARDYERLLAHHEAMVQLAAILQMTRRLASASPA